MDDVSFNGTGVGISKPHFFNDLKDRLESAARKGLIDTQFPMAKDLKRGGLMMKNSLLRPENVCLQVVDVQESLMAKICDADEVISTVELMIRCAKIFKIPILANTQYLKGLGPYVAQLEELTSDMQRIDKVEFNASANKATEAFIGDLPKSVTTIALVGVETHICIYQTAMGLLERGLKVWIVADGVSSRKAGDHTVGLSRLKSVGAIIGTAEMLIYELLGRAGTTEFKQVLPLIVSRNN